MGWAALGDRSKLPKSGLMGLAGATHEAKSATATMPSTTHRPTSANRFRA